MAEERGALRWISWRDCCPWLVLFRSFSLSVAVRSLILATFGAVLIALGWWLFGKMFFDRSAEYFGAVQMTVEQNEMLPGATEGWPQAPVGVVPGGWQWLVAVMPRTPVYGAWRTVSEPFIQWYNPANGYRMLGYYFLGGLWTLMVWAFVGGAISRIGVVQLGREERVGLFDALGYARKYFFSYFGGPLFPLVGLALFAIPIYILGWIMLADVGVVVGGVLWFLVILDGLILALLALGILFGWPLMWGTISAEGSDAFDSLSRCFAYTFQRPLHYAFYLLVTVVFGALGWMVVTLFADLVIDLSYWAIAWGAGHERINELSISAAVNGGGAFGCGATMINFWVSCVRAIAASWWYAFFFISMGGVYLLIRRDVDQTETDEIYIEEGDDTYGMPPLTTDEQGVPKAADMPDATAEGNGSSDGESSEKTDSESPSGGNDEASGDGEKPDA